MKRRIFNHNIGLTQTVLENPEDLMYIYVLIHPLTKAPFYVGRSQNVIIRIANHLSQLNNFSGRGCAEEKIMILKDIVKSNLFPEFNILETTIRRFSDERERYWIQQYKEKGIKLTNGRSNRTKVKRKKVAKLEMLETI